MKACFSTLGCPEWSFNEILSVARDFQYDGIEIRGIANELYAPAIKVFSDENIEAAKEALARRGLEIPILTASCLLCAQDGACLPEGRAYIELAKKLGTPYVRLLADRDPQQGAAVDDGTVRNNLLALAAHAGDGVTLLIETNGAFADSARMKALMRDAACPNVGVLWDVHHPYRFMGEPLEATYGALAEYIRHIHYKDSAVTDGKLVYRVPGEGDFPVPELARLLKGGGYDRYISLEWVRRWNPELEEAGIVFAVYARYIRSVWDKA